MHRKFLSILPVFMLVTANLQREREKRRESDAPVSIDAYASKSQQAEPDFGSS
jgi:hypothetical protein